MSSVATDALPLASTLALAPSWFTLTDAPALPPIVVVYVSPFLVVTVVVLCVLPLALAPTLSPSSLTFASNLVSIFVFWLIF